MSTSLTSKIKEFNELDVSSIIRESFGEASLIKAKPILEDIADKLTTIDKYQNNVDKESNSKVDGVMQQLLNLLKSIKNLPKEQFVNSQDSHYAQIISFHNEIIKYWPSYVTAAIVSNGFLDAEQSTALCVGGDGNACRDRLYGDAGDAGGCPCWRERRRSGRHHLLGGACWYCGPQRQADDGRFLGAAAVDAACCHKFPDRQ